MDAQLARTLASLMWIVAGGVLFFLSAGPPRRTAYYKWGSLICVQWGVLLTGNAQGWWRPSALVLMVSAMLIPLWVIGAVVVSHTARRYDDDD